MTPTVCCHAGRENPAAGRLTAASRKGMGLLTTEHGKAGYLVDCIIFAVASTALQQRRQRALIGTASPHATS
jgi:hypothetical protein